MNERIYNLIKQSEVSIGSIRHFNGHIDINKFAELIVRECAVIADTERPNSLGCGYITKTNGMRIIEHFGVEE
jgi:hypothetical protein